nr:hypothetical protein [Tanacetum cinerariifolium]
MTIYNVKLEQFQVNTKFLNTLPPEWSKFMMNVKLVWDLYTTNIDQLHAYLGQHEFHANEVRVLHERLIVSVFKQGDDPIDAINHMMSFLSAVVTSRFPTTNNLLRNSSNPRQQATIHDGRVTVQPVQGRQISYATGVQERLYSKQLSVVNHTETEITSDSNIIPYSQDQSAQTIHMLTKPQSFYNRSTKQALDFQNPFYLKKARQLERKLYDGDVIQTNCAIVIPDSEETLLLAEESHSKMILKQKDRMVLEKKVNTKPIDYAALN